MNGAPCRVLGIDPGSRRLGLAVVEGDPRRQRAVAFATVAVGTGEIGARLRAIHTNVVEWIERYAPTAAAVEDVFVHRGVRSALMLGQARGVALLALAQYGLVPVSIAPARVKAAVGGHGRARKEEMRQMVRLQLNLDRLPSADAADALAVALTALVTPSLVAL